MDKIAKALDIPVEAITELEQGTAINIISSTFHDSSIASMMYCQPTFNPIDKVAELYERLLQAEKEKVALLQEVLRDKQ